MNGHLSSEDVSRWLAGERTPDDERHAGECAECAAKLARTEELFGAFGESVRTWSGHVGQGFSPAAVLPHGAPRPSAAAARKGRLTLVAAAAAALLLLIAVPVWDAREKRRAAEQAKADALLWEQVDAHITRAAPESLTPLLDLVAWEPPTVNQSKKGENR